MTAITMTGKDCSIQSILSKAEQNIAQGTGQEPYFSSHNILDIIETLQNKDANFIPNQFVPSDFLQPNWNNKEQNDNWKNYISLEMQDIWDTFTVYQKSTISLNAKYQRANIFVHNTE